MHDGKMIYALTQHSAWSRKNHPFLLCACKRGEGVKNQNHTCAIISHSEQVRLFDRSIRRWERQKDVITYTKKKVVVRYTKEKHLDWCDLENKGITHYGFHPDRLPRDNIRFDIFHLRSAITKLLMEYLRRFIQKQSHKMIQKFSKLMLSFWGDFHVSVWRLNKKIHHSMVMKFYYSSATFLRLSFFLRKIFAPIQI